MPDSGLQAHRFNLVLLATFPRSGSSWTRTLLRGSTQIKTDLTTVKGAATCTSLWADSSGTHPCLSAPYHPHFAFEVLYLVHTLVDADWGLQSDVVSKSALQDSASSGTPRRSRVAQTAPMSTSSGRVYQQLGVGWLSSSKKARPLCKEIGAPGRTASLAVLLQCFCC